jgi:hypothetical protein
VKRIDIEDATEPLAAYARRIRKNPLLVTRRGRPIAALVRVEGGDWEDFVVSTSPAFAAIIERSRARQAAEGGLTTDEVKRRLRAGHASRKVTRQR